MAETRQKLLEAGRKAFGTIGYAELSMDDFTAEANLTRGALYHHFGDKQGLLRAVVAQIDSEISDRLQAISDQAPSRWDGLVAEMTAYIELALEPEIQRIMFRDAPAVLGDVSQWPNANACMTAVKNNLDAVKADGKLVDIDTEVAARLINGASAHAAIWIAGADDPEETSKRAVAGFCTLLESLKTK